MTKNIERNFGSGQLLKNKEHTRGSETLSVLEQAKRTLAACEDKLYTLQQEKHDTQNNIVELARNAGKYAEVAKIEIETATDTLSEINKKIDEAKDAVNVASHEIYVMLTILINEKKTALQDLKAFVKEGKIPADSPMLESMNDSLKHTQDLRNNFKADTRIVAVEARGFSVDLNRQATKEEVIEIEQGTLGVTGEEPSLQAKRERIQTGAHQVIEARSPEWTNEAGGATSVLAQLEAFLAAEAAAAQEVSI